MMQNKMLWFDNSTATAETKIQKAADYFVKKYGAQPTQCVMHPDALKNDTPHVAGIKVSGSRSVLPGHIWIGVDDKPEPPFPG